MSNGKKLLGIAIIIGLLLWYFNFFEQPEDTVDQFANAYNSGDVLQMIELINPEETKEVYGMIKLAGAVSEMVVGTDLVDALLPLLPSFVGFIETETGAEMPKMKFEYINKHMNLLRTEATILVNVTVSYDGEHESERGIIEMKKIDRKWYIMDMHEY